MDHLMSVAFLAQGLRISVPYVLTALGGTLCERAGVINLALEGMLLLGAFSAALGSYHGGPVVGVLAGALGGSLLAGIYATCVLRFRANQIIAGIALNLLVLGLTRYLLKMIFHSTASSPQVPGIDGAEWQVGFVAGCGLLVLATHVLVSRTRLGLRLRAVGEHPEAAGSLGVSVLGTRAVTTCASGLLAGLGGAWLALDNQGFVDRMSGGRGYIAIAAMIFGKWHPLGATAACLLFGFAEALQVNLQASATGVPRELVQVLPYLLTLVALCGFMGKAQAPGALGKPFPPT
ncbi:MAG: ABC transporter permease [Deltaproteobacteria bacterium]|nr:ABC transporter permease [Deltaproteobacteria bacterium]